MNTRSRCLGMGIAAISLALGVPAASAQDAKAPTDLLTVSCADYLQAISIAQPGSGSSADRKAAAEQAQDDIVSAMLWVHGYQSGRQPTGTAFAPLTRQWIADQVVKVAKACKAHSPDGTMALSDAAARP